MSCKVVLVLVLCVVGALGRVTRESLCYYEIISTYILTIYNYCIYYILFYPNYYYK